MTLDIRDDFKESVITVSGLDQKVIEFAQNNNTFPDAIIMTKEQYVRMCSWYGLSAYPVTYKDILLYVDDLFIKGSIK